MAFIVNAVDTQQTTASTTFALGVGAHQSGDLLLSFVAQDAGTGTFTVPTGWTAIGTQATGGLVRALWAYKVATSSSEACQWSSTLSDEWSGSVLVVRDFHADILDGTPAKVDTSTFVNTHVSGSVTTASNGGLVLTGWGIDSSAVQRQIKTKINDMACAGKLSAATVSHAVGFRLQPTAGATSTVTGYLNNTAQGQSWTIVIKNAVGGALQPDLRTDVTTVCHYGDFGVQYDGITLQSASNFAASISGINCSTSLSSTASQSVASDPWGSFTSVGSQESLEVWAGASHTISSTNFTGKIIAVSWARNVESTSTYQGANGVIVGFSDGTNWVAYQVATKEKGWQANAVETAFIDHAAATPFASSGSINWGAVTRVLIAHHRAAVGTTYHAVYVRNLALFGSNSIVGGGSSRPANFVDYHNALTSWNGSYWTKLQASAQVLARSSVQLGDGTIPTVFDSSASSLEFPPAWSASNVPNWQMDWNAGVGSATINVKGASGDSISLAAGVTAAAVRQTLTIDAAASTGATYNFSGQSIVGFTPTWKTGIGCEGATFSKCEEVAFKGANVSNSTIKKTVSTDAACSWDTSGATVTNTVIDVTGTSAAYHIELGASVTGITLSDVTFTGTPGTDKVHVKATTGTVTITIDGITSLVAGDVTSDGATVVISAPTLERGQEFTGLVAGSFVRVVTSDDVTQKFEDLSSATSETWDDASGGSISVDYSIMKAGLVPIRVPGVTLTGAVGSGIQSVPVDQVVDRGYTVSSGLTIGVDTFATVGTKLFGLTKASTTRNFYSYLIEQWIALGNTGEAYANKDFPMESTGANSFTARNGWKFDLTTYPNSISYLSRGGLRYLDTSENVTDLWAAFLTTGVPGTLTVRYKHASTGAWSSAASAGNMDQLVKLIEDPNGDGVYTDGFNRTGTMIVRVQGEGYDMAEVDVVGTFSALDNYLYSIAPVPTANGIATGNPTLNGSPAITVGTFVQGGKTFSIKIVDGAGGNTGTDLMRWIRYAQGQGGTFQGREANDWHDLIRTNGDDFKTVRGTIYGPTATAGVIVYMADGTTLHPDFTLFTADNGDTLSNTPPAQATATILANSRVQLYNVTTATELLNTFETGTGYAQTLSSGVSVGDTLRLRVCKLGYQSAEAQGVWTATGCPFIISQSTDPVYAAWGIDGSTVTEFAPDTTGHIYIESNDPDGVSSKARLGAYYNYLLTTEGGIRYYYGGMSFLSTASIRVNTAVINLLIENVNATTALKFSDVDVRLYRDDGTSIIAPTSYSIHNDYSGVPDVVETGVSGLTGAESAQLMGLPSATGVVSAIWTEAGTNPMPADMKKTNGTVVKGNGTEADKFRSILVA